MRLGRGSKVSKPEHIGGVLQRYLADLQHRIPTLAMSADELDALEAAEQVREQDKARAIAHLQLGQLERTLPEHYAWALAHKASSWTEIRMGLRRALQVDPSAWVLMGSPPGNAKTTALVAEGIRAIREGRSVVYVRGFDEWRSLTLKGQLAGLKTCGLLLADELHDLPPADDDKTGWVTRSAMSVIDHRYMRRLELQVLGSGTMPIKKLVARLPPGMVDRFDVRLGATEKSQRRNR